MQRDEGAAKEDNEKRAELQKKMTSMQVMHRRGQISMATQLRGEITALQREIKEARKANAHREARYFRVNIRGEDRGGGGGGGSGQWRQRQQEEQRATLSFWCMHAGIALKDLKERLNVRNIILTSGVS